MRLDLIDVQTDDVELVGQLRELHNAFDRFLTNHAQVSPDNSSLSGQLTLAVNWNRLLCLKHLQNPGIFTVAGP